MGLSMLAPSVSVAQDEVEGTVGVDLVSSYIWRGQDLAGVSIQPTVGISWKGLSLSAWGSTAFEGAAGNTTELDLTLSYTVCGFTVGVTDYWFGGDDYFMYKARRTTHVFEANVGYDFGFLALNWYTNFAGADYLDSGKRAYSSYFDISAPFKLGGFDWVASVGGLPYKGCQGIYGDNRGFAIIDVSLGVSKDIKINDSFSIPAFAKITMNPRSEGAYFTFGLSL